MSMLSQAKAEVSREEREQALSLLREYTSQRRAEDQPPYALAEALFLHYALGGPPPPEPPRPLALLASLILIQAAVALERSDCRGGAILCLGAAQELDPQRETLIRLHFLCHARGLWSDVAEIFRALLALEENRLRRRELWVGLTRVLEDPLARHGEAADAYATAAAEFPEVGDFLTGQARCLEAARRYDELLGVIYRQISAEKSDAKLALLHTRMASLQETVLNNEVRAMEHYRTAVRLAPAFEPPIQGLLAIAERRGDWATVVEVLKIRLRTEARPKERATVLTRLGEVVAQQLKDPRKALTYLERAIREYPRGLQARLLILELLCEQREFARAERFATPPDVSEAQGLNASQLARLCQIRARVAAERGRPLEALECLTLALEVAPKPRPILEDLVNLLKREEPESSPPEVLARKARDWERDEENELAALALLAQGLLLQYQGRIEAAERALVHARTLAPGVPSFAEALAELYYRSRRFAEAAHAFLDAARPGHPSEARLTVRAAQILAEHLGQNDRGLEALRGLHARGSASSDSCLYAASLALALGRADEAQAALDLAAGWVPADRQYLLQGLRVDLWRARRASPAALEATLLQAARAGDERSVRALAHQCLERGQEDLIEQVLQAIPKERLSAAQRIVGDAWRRKGSPERALEYYRRALDSSGGQSLDAIEGMALLAPQEALHGLEYFLSAEPFNPHGLSLLSTLLTATGELERAKSLYELAALFQDGPRDTPPPQLERFWSSLEVTDPFLSFIILLRQKLPRAFEPREAAIAARGRPVTLPEDVRQQLTRVCALGRLSVPTVLTHPHVGPDPLVLTGPFALIVSPRLFRSDMPHGALLFTLLRGVAQLGLGLSALTYLAPYQLDVMAEALRSAAAPEGPPTGANPPAWLLGGVLETSLDEAEEVLDVARTYPGAISADPLFARVVQDGAILRAALASTGSLISSLASLSLVPPPTLAFQATRGRWLRQLARLPLARAAMGYTLSDHFAKLQPSP